MYVLLTYKRKYFTNKLIITALPTACPTFDPVLFRMCLYDLWITAGCTDDGTGNPLLLSARKYMEWFGDKNYR